MIQGDPGFKIGKGSSPVFVITCVIFDDELEVEKTKITSDELKTSKQSFYNYAIKMVLKHSFGTIKEAKVRLDGHGDRIYKREVIRYLRKELNNKENRRKNIF